MGSNASSWQMLLVQWFCPNLSLKCQFSAPILVLFCHFQPLQGLEDPVGHVPEAFAETAWLGMIPYLTVPPCPQILVMSQPHPLPRGTGAMLWKQLMCRNQFSL